MLLLFMSQVIQSIYKSPPVAKWIQAFALAQQGAKHFSIWKSSDAGKPWGYSSEIKICHMSVSFTLRLQDPMIPENITMLLFIN